MDDLNRSEDELINEINTLKIQNAELKQELDFYKKDNKIKKKYEVDYTQIEGILDAMPSAVVIIDTDGKFSYLNKRALKLYGINYLGYDMDSHLAKIKALKLDGTPYSDEDMPAVYSLKHDMEV